MNGGVQGKGATHGSGGASTGVGTGGASAACTTEGVAAIEEGKQTFRYDTFGDEAFWGDTLKLHQAIEGRRTGGVGPGVSPKTALAVGLKVDVDALPATSSQRHRSAARSTSTIRRRRWRCSS